MKKNFASVVHWVGGISCLGMLFSLILPFFCYSFWGQSSEEYLLFDYVVAVLDGELGQFVGSIGLQKAADTFVLMCFGIVALFVVFFLSMVFFSDGDGMGSSIVMLIFSIGEWILFDKVSSAIFSSSISEKLIGATVMEWSCIGFIATSVLAFIVDIINWGYHALKIEIVPNMTEKMQCPHCGKIVSEGDSFCGGCGHSLEKMVCLKCGKEYAYGDSFCKNCGEKLCETAESVTEAEEIVTEEELEELALTFREGENEII